MLLLSVCWPKLLSPNRQVPKQILGQYATQTYLIIWGILNTALGGRKIKVPFLGYKKTRLFFRSPVLFIYYLIESMRKEKNLFYLIIASIASALVTVLVVGLFSKEVWLIIVPLIVLLVFIPMVNWISDKMKMGTDKK